LGFILFQAKRLELYLLDLILMEMVKLKKTTLKLGSSFTPEYNQHLGCLLLAS